MVDQSDSTPLGQHPQFCEWMHSKKWSGGDAKFGPGVVDHLVAGIHAFRETVEASNARLSPRHHQTAVAVGCVPWLTSSAVVDALAPFAALVMIDKGCNSTAARRLAGSKPVGTWSAILGTDDYAPIDKHGRPRTYGPFDEPHDQYGPVRKIGWRQDRPGKPLLHTKMLVLGTARYYDELEHIGWSRMRPERAWVGSANWTEASASHLEFGTWVDDPTEHVGFANIALAHLRSLLLFSEPFDAPTLRPEPNLAPADFDIDFDDLW